MFGDKNYKGSERRQFKRVEKSFLMSYRRENDPQNNYEITQIKNISLGGMCFVCTQNLESGSRIDIDLKTPFLADKISLKATVLESYTMVQDTIYRTRVQFDSLDQSTQDIFTKFINYFIEEEKRKHEDN